MSRKQLWGQSAQYLVIKGIAAGVSLLGFVVFTRLLTTGQYGRYSLVLTSVGLINLVAFNWIKLGLLRFLPAHRENPGRLLSTVAGLFLAAAAVVTVAGAVLALLWQGLPLRRYFLVGGFLLGAQAWLQMNQEVARAELNPRRYGWITVARAVLGIILASVLAWAGFGPGGVLFGLALGFLLPTLPLLRRIWGRARPTRVDRGLLREFLAYGVPLSITASLAFILAGSDRFMIAALMGDAEVGVYSAAYDLGHHVLATICMTIGLAGTPLVINALEKNGWGEAKAQYIRNGNLFLALAIPAALGLVGTAPAVIRLALGEEFRARAEPVFVWVILGVLFQCLKFYYLDSAFFLHKATRFQIWIVLPAAALNIGLNWLLLPRFGIEAAAWSTAASYLLALVATLLYVQTGLAMPVPWRQAARTLAAGLLMTAALFGCRAAGAEGLLILVPAGVAVYLVGSFVFRVEEIQALAAAALRRGAAGGGGE